MKDINRAPGPSNGDSLVERAVTHPIVEGMIATQVDNLKDHFLKPGFQNAESLNRVGKVLENFARLIASKFEEIRDVEPIDTSVPGWEERLGIVVYAIRQNQLSMLADGRFLAEQFSDAAGGEPSDWLNEEKEHLMKIVALRIMEFTLGVAYCQRFNVDPELLRR